MTRKPLIYGLISLVTGSIITALVILLTTEAAPRSLGITWTAPMAVLPSMALAEATTPQPSPAPLPWRSGMMGNPEQHFIVMMIPHHNGAIAMADLALTRATHPEIKQLAQSIQTTQRQENQQMIAWYKQWYGADVPDWQPGMGMSLGMRRGGYGMGRMGKRTMAGQNSASDPGWGMMGRGGMGCMNMTPDLEALKAASDFDRAFIEAMIPHHQMGVMMAQMALVHSDRPEIHTLADSIVKTQTAEIKQMEAWYQAWYR
ncbi:DUF305 domain-containing protein [Pantanalinema rosaneae CENA516]|uniref:DUF305 domain-containing protein n=1 Tax=Pantanalinema rosaneae TaxID=1620701 RepID=UPI003D6FC433